MRFSVWAGTSQGWDDIVDLARYADGAPGWHAFYVADHFMPNAPEPVEGDMLECWGVLTAVAAMTTNVRLASLVCSTTYRHPTVLANIAATTDIISSGRLTLGLGAGWQMNEHEAYGIELGSLRERMDRFEEACEIVTSMLRTDRTTVEGSHYTVRDAPCEPKPAGNVPLLIGGGGEQRTLRITARFADEWNIWSDPETFAHKSSVLDERCGEIDRDPTTIHRSTQAMVFLSEDEAWLERHRGDTSRSLVGTPAEVVERLAEYRDAGVQEFIVPDFTLGTGTRRRETLELWREQVAPAFAS